MGKRQIQKISSRFSYNHNWIKFHKKNNLGTEIEDPNEWKARMLFGRFYLKTIMFAKVTALENTFQIQIFKHMQCFLYCIVIGEVSTLKKNLALTKKKKNVILEKFYVCWKTVSWRVTETTCPKLYSFMLPNSAVQCCSSLRQNCCHFRKFPLLPNTKHFSFCQNLSDFDLVLASTNKN